MFFSDAFLEELDHRTDIVSLISQYVALKRQGGRFLGLCPFHNEKTPSFSVSPDKQLFYCFGCGVGGGATQFVMRAENLAFPDAVAFLAAKVNFPLPDTGANPDEKARLSRLFALNRAAARYFYDTLRSGAHPAASEYCARRSLSSAALVRFGIGYAPDAWSSLSDAMTAAGFSKMDLLDAGLVVKNKSGGLYDRFRGRLMFPIVNVRRQVVGFGGRALGDATPKYLNSPETPVFSKHNHLFALNIAKDTKQGRLILAEGYMDVVSLHQSGFDCAVASLGTALTDRQVLLLSKYTKEVVVAYDMDNAGQNATLRALSLLDKSGVSVRVLHLPNAKDPDEFIQKHGREAFAALLHRSKPQAEHRLSMLAARFDLSANEGKANFCRASLPLLASLPTASERDIYTRRAAQLGGVSYDSLLSDVKRAIAARYKQARKETERKALQPLRTFQPSVRALRYDNPRSAGAEEEIIRAIIQNPEFLGEFSHSVDPNDFSSPTLRTIWQWLLSRWNSGLSISASAFEQHSTSEESSLLARILCRPGSDNGGRQALVDSIAVLKEENLYKLAEEMQSDPLLLMQQRKREKQ